MQVISCADVSHAYGHSVAARFAAWHRFRKLGRPDLPRPGPRSTCDARRRVRGPVAHRRTVCGGACRCHRWRWPGLRSWRTVQSAEHLWAGTAWHRSDYVLTTDSGRLLDHRLNRRPRLPSDNSGGWSRSWNWTSNGSYSSPGWTRTNNRPAPARPCGGVSLTMLPLARACPANRTSFHRGRGDTRSMARRMP